MKYTLHNNNVIYIIAGRNEFTINVVKGKIWITVENDARDLILSDGNVISLKSSGKVAIQSFGDSHVLLEGNKFILHELIQNDRKIHLNKIKIGQTNKQ